MIIRTKPSSEVCLRCQLCLSGQLRARRPRASTPGPLGGFRARNLHATSRITQAHEDSQNKESGEHNAEAESKPDSHNSTTKTRSSAPEDADQFIYRYDPEKRLSAVPLGRMYGLNGNQLRENTKKLGVDSLGKPAEVIVLQDSGTLRYVAAQPSQSTIQAPVVDILAEFNSERGLIGRDQVNDNIETLRPQGKVLPWTDIRVIEDQLSDGFTMAQLLYYVETTERQRMAALAKGAASDTQAGEIAEEVAEAAQPVEIKAQDIILRQSPWMPGTSDQGDYFDESSLRGYISEAFTPKQRVALNILRLCWGVESQELVSSVGEMELQVKNADLDLLLSPKGRSDPPLQAISDELIRNDEEKIEVFRARRAIRITATRAKAKAIADGIRTTLEGVHRIEVPLTGLKKPGRKVKGAEEADELDESVLAELARLTNTEVVRTSKDKLGVHGLGRKQGSSLSTSADAARRLLLSSSDIADRTVYRHGCKETSSPAYAVDYEYHHNMSWRNRLRRWSRWQTPIEKADPEEALSIEESDQKELDKPSKADKALETQAENQALASVSMSPHHKAAKLDQEKVKQYELQESNLWSTTPITSTSATIGNVLHQNLPGSEPVDVSKPVHFDGKEIMNARTLFVPSTKNLSRLVSGMKDDRNTRTSSVLTMKFLPSPWSGENLKQLSKFPTLEMNFSMSSAADNRFKLANMAAITEDICSDVMLPDKALDIRFRQKTLFPFIAANLEAYPEITEFLEASQLGQRSNVMTPPELVVPIPDFMTSLKGDKGTTSSASTAVRYLFAGLTYRTQISYDFRDWRLRYSSVNSGKADGRHGELALLPKHRKSSESITAKNERALNQELTMDYIKSAYALVDTLESLDKPVVRRTESKESKPLDSVVGYEYMPPVHYAGTGRTSTPQKFSYFDRGISFEDENDDAAW